MPLTSAIQNLPTLRKSDVERGGRGDLIQAVRGNPNSHYRTSLTTLTARDHRTGDSPENRRAREE